MVHCSNWRIQKTKELDQARSTRLRRDAKGGSYEDNQEFSENIIAECHCCGFFAQLNDLGLCEECATKLERDLIRQQDWEYSTSAFGLSLEAREALHRQIIKQYGADLELIAPRKKSYKKRSSRKR